MVVVKQSDAQSPARQLTLQQKIGYSLLGLCAMILLSSHIMTAASQAEDPEAAKRTYGSVCVFIGVLLVGMIRSFVWTDPVANEKKDDKPAAGNADGSRTSVDSEGDEKVTRRRPRRA